MDEAEFKYLTARSKRRTVDDPTSEDLFLTTSEHAKTIRQSHERYLGEIHRRAALKAPGSTNPFNILFSQHLSLRDSWNMANILSRGIELTGSFEIDQHHTKSWQQPAFHLPTPPFKIEMVNTVEFDPNKFQDQVICFNQGLSAYRLNHHNVDPVAMSLDTVTVSSTDMDLIIDCHNKQQACSITIHEIEDSEMSGYRQLPALLLISNGYYAIGFNFGLKDVSVGPERTEVSYSYSELPDQVRRFLKSLPFLYTHQRGLSMDRVLNEFFLDLYGADIKLNILDITSVAVAAGIRADYYGLFTLSAIVVGLPFPDIEGIFGYEFIIDNKLSNLYKKYLIERIISLDNVYAILVGLLVRQMFPDPDITLAITGMSQHSFTYWFSAFLNSALYTDKNLHKLSTAEMSTRCEMIKSITDEDNDYAKALCELLIDVPVAQEGGERFLHHARRCFLDQYIVIKRLNFDNFVCQAPNQEVDIDQLGYRFLYKREVDSKHHGLPVIDLGLLPNPEFDDSIFKLDPFKDDVSVLFRQEDRDLIPAVEEWGRLNVDDIKVLIDRIRALRTDQLARFWVPKIRLYEILIGVYYRITNEHIRVNYLERCISIKLSNVKTHHEELQVRKDSQYQQIRKDFVLHNIQAGTSRVGLHQEAVSKVPGFNATKNAKKLEKRKARLARRKSENTENWVSRATIRKAKIMRRTESTEDLGSRESVNEAKAIGSLDADDLRRKLV